MAERGGTAAPEAVGAAPAGRPRTVYGLAVALSVMGSVLGLGRELVLLEWLGLSRRNDELQLYLSIIYTVSLLGESVRLATLNTRGRRGLRVMVALILGVGTLVSGAVTVAFAAGTSARDPFLLAVSAVAASANLVVVALLVHRQRHAAFLPTHAVTVAPNILIFGGLLAVRAAGVDPIRSVVCLFAAAPFTQLVALLLIPTAPDDGHEPPAADVLRQSAGALALHSVSVAGQQAGQILVRTAMTALGPGMLSLFAILMRVFDTIRAVLVDSYIGSRVATWSRGNRHIPRPLDFAHVPSLLLAGLAALSLLVAGGSWPGRTAFAAVVLMLLSVGMYGTAVARIGYYYLNAAGAKRRVIVAIGAIDLLLALIGVALWRTLGGRTVLALLALFAVVRPSAQIALLQRAVPGPASRGRDH